MIFILSTNNQSGVCPGVSQNHPFFLFHFKSVLSFLVSGIFCTEEAKYLQIFRKRNFVLKSVANFSCQNSTSYLLIHYTRAYKPSSNLTDSQRVLEIPHTYGWDPLKGCRQVALLLKQASESPGNLLKQTADSVGLIWAQEFAFLAISWMMLMPLMPWPRPENRCINPCALTSNLERYWLFSTHTNFKVKKIRKTAKTLKNSFAALTYSRDPGFHNHLLKSLLLILWPSGFLDPGSFSLAKIFRIFHIPSASLLDHCCPCLSITSLLLIFWFG